MGCGASTVKERVSASPVAINKAPAQASEPVVIEPVKAPPVLLDRPPRHPSLAVTNNNSVHSAKKIGPVEDAAFTIKSPLASAVLNYAFDDNYKKEVEKAFQTGEGAGNPVWQRSKSRSLMQQNGQTGSNGDASNLSSRPVSPGYTLPDAPSEEDIAPSPLPFEPARVDRTLCVFLCSAAMDPAARDSLFAQSIPKLRYACARRGLILCVTDLLEDTGLDATSLSRAVRQLDRSQYFVAFVGEGYDPAPVPPDVVAGVPELRGRPGAGPGAFLLDLLVDAGPMSAARRGSLGPRSIFVWSSSGAAEGPEVDGAPLPPASAAAAALRKRVQAVGQHRDAKTAQQACKFVERGLAGAIDRDYPAEQSAQVIARTAHAQLSEYLVRESEAGGYVERMGLWADFLPLLEAPPGSREPIYIVGPAGSGKSTFLVRWAEKHRRSNPNDVIVLHHVAAECVADPVPPAVILARLAQELAARFAIERESLPPFYPAAGAPAASGSPLPGSPPPKAFPSFSSLTALTSVSISGRASEVLGTSGRRPSSSPPAGDHFACTFGEVLARAAACCRGRLFLVLDGLERALDAAEGDPLSWLPPAASLSPNVTLLVASRPGREAPAGFRALPVPPLAPAERAALAEKAGAPSADHPLCDRPAGVKLLARAARASSPESALAADSLEALHDLILAQVESSLGRDALRMLRLVRCSRSGLSEPELVHLVGLATHAAAVDVLEGLHRAGALIRLAGLHTLPSPELVAAFDRRQFGKKAGGASNAPPSPATAAIASPPSPSSEGAASRSPRLPTSNRSQGAAGMANLANAPAPSIPASAPTHPRRAEALRTLRDHFAAYPSCVRRAQELPWALFQLSDAEGMERVLAELPLMDVFLRGGLEAELASAWRAAIGGSPAAPSPALGAVVGGAVFDAYRAALRPLRATAGMPAPPAAPGSTAPPAPAGPAPTDVGSYAHRAACLLAALGRPDEAFEMLRVVEGDAAPLSDDGTGGSSPFLTPLSAAAPAGTRRPSSIRQRPSYTGSASSLRAPSGSIRSLDAIGSSVRAGAAYPPAASLAAPGVEGSGLPPAAFAEAVEPPLRAQAGRLRAALLRAGGQQAEAVQALEAALELEERSPSRPGAVVAAIATLRALAGLYFERAEYERAAALLEEAALAHQQLPVAEGGGPLAGAALLMALARVHRTRMDREKALSLADRALFLQRRSAGPHHFETANTMIFVADLLRNQGHLPGALDAYQKSLPVLERVWGPTHPRVSQTLTAIGDIYRMRGLLDEALPLYQRATEIRVKFLGTDQHAEVANLLATEAGMLKDVGQLEAALEIYERVLRIQTACLGPKSPKVSVTINCIDATRRAIKEAHKEAADRARSVSVPASGGAITPAPSGSAGGTSP